MEIYGPEASGKTTLALHIIAEAQKQGGNWSAQTIWFFYFILEVSLNHIIRIKPVTEAYKRLLSVKSTLNFTI